MNPTNTTPTQVANPVKAALRTFVQAAVSVIGFLTVAIPTLNAVAPQILDAIRPLLPESWVAYAAGVVVTIGVIAAAFARLMAIKQINDALTKIGLGATPSKDAK